MGRINKNKSRNENKYKLPEGITLIEGQDPHYRKTTKLLFLDQHYGQFESCFKDLMNASASTHPVAVQKRRENTNNSKYGVPNVSIFTREKATNTMVELYGVTSALKSDVFLNKQKNTNVERYGFDNPSKNKHIANKMSVTNTDLFNNDLELIERMKKICIERHGSETPFESQKIRNKGKATLKNKYGAEYALQCPQFKEKLLKTLTDNGSGMSSKGELELKEYVISLGFNAKSGYIGGKNPKQIDIKIENSNIALEYNGIYWHNELTIPTNYHLEKTELCAEKNIRLIHVFDFEWQNRNSQVKSFLRSALGKNENIVYARKCVVKEVDKQIAKEFLNTYHILGTCGFQKALGLYYNDELLSLITIGKHHRNGYEYVLSRFVGKTNYNVVGGLSRLTKAAVIEFGELTTWIDRRWSDGNNWLKSGWEFVHQLKPDYFYFDSKTGDIVSKQMRQKKNVGTPENVTEHEHALQDKLYRIHDCGKIKLIFKKEV